MTEKTANFRLPKDFQEWRYCIEVLCGTPLTQKYVEQRRAELASLDSKLDRRFVELYGKDHLVRVRGWFEKVWEEKSFTREVGV